MGQLIMITDTVLDESNASVNIRGIGDLPCRVSKVWQPSTLRGLQMAWVEAYEAAPSIGELIQTCEADADLAPFARILLAAPQVLDRIRADRFTAFVPTKAAL